MKENKCIICNGTEQLFPIAIGDLKESPCVYLCPSCLGFYKALGVAKESSTKTYYCYDHEENKTNMSKAFYMEI